MAVEIGDKDIT